MEPLGKMNAYFPIINEQISKRNKKVHRLFIIYDSLLIATSSSWIMTQREINSTSLH